jgi:hypothetical protein
MLQREMPRYGDDTPEGVPNADGSALGSPDDYG